MGNGEEKIAEQPNSEGQETKEEKTEEVKEEEKTEQQTPAETKKEEKTEEKKEPEKKNTEELRKVIKVNQDEKTEAKEETKDVDLEDTGREGLEQKRAILQSIKDFDFQIKKNQEEVTALNQKLDAVTKDLDDLVSLYEIVSEQMNPFVGLSKVTKKRIDALENFTKVIEELNTRMGDLESFAEMAGANLQEIRVSRGGEPSEKPEIKETPVQNESGSVTVQAKTTPAPQMPLQNQEIDNGDLDLIIERAFESLSADNEIDNLINEFIENLKG